MTSFISSDSKVGVKATRIFSKNARKYCADIVRNRLGKNQTSILCNFCDEPVHAIAKQSKCIRSHYLIDHVRKHLGKSSYLCQLCGFGTSSLMSAQYHVHKIHNFPRNPRQNLRCHITDLSGTFSKELIDMVDRCFVHDKKVEKTKKPNGVFDFFQRLFDQNRPDRCRLCDFSLRCRKWDRVRRGFDHALNIHFYDNMVKCRLCPAKYRTLSTIKYHMRSKHKQRAFKDVNYDGDLEDYADQIKALLENCYGAVNDLEGHSSMSAEDTMESDSETEIHEETRKLVMPRKPELLPVTTNTTFDYCRDLFNRLGQAIDCCRVCNFKVRDCKDRAYKAFDHVFLHFRKYIFKCLICKCPHRTLTSLRKHLKPKHDQSAIKGVNYDGDVEDYFDQIKALLDYCYGEAKGLGKYWSILTLDTSTRETVKTKKTVKTCYRPSSYSKLSNRQNRPIVQSKLSKSNQLLLRPPINYRDYSDFEQKRGQGYNLRPRCQKKQAQDREAQCFVSSCFIAKLTHRFESGLMYRCRYCLFSSRYGTLVRDHMRLMHI